MTRALCIVWLAVMFPFAFGGEGTAAGEIEGVWTGSTIRPCGRDYLHQYYKGKLEINIADKVISGHLYREKDGKKPI